MSALSIQPTYPIFTDIDGQPLEAGYVWIGTANLDPQTNPINVYWDAALTILAPQPIRTLAGYPSNNGTPARLYVNSDYSIRVMNKNGSTVYSAPEPTEAYGGGIINANQVVYDPAGLGAVPTTVQTKLRETVSVKDFGAVGDGVADDTAAIQAAIAAAQGGTLFFPEGNYLVNSQIDVGNILLTGNATITKGNTVAARFLFKTDSGTVIQDLTLRSLGTTTYGAGALNMAGIITLKEAAKNIQFRNVKFIEVNNTYSAISIDNPDAGPLYAVNVENVLVDGCRFQGFTRPMYLSCIDYFTFTNNVIEDCRFDAIRTRKNMEYMIFDNNTFRRIGVFPPPDTQTRDALDTKWAGRSLIFSNNLVEQVAYVGVDIKGGTDGEVNEESGVFARSYKIIITGNHFKNISREAIKTDLSGDCITISDNIIDTANLASTSEAGINVENPNSIITNNQLINCGRGINVANAGAGIIIDGNTFTNNNDVDIRISGTSTVNMVNNVFNGYDANYNARATNAVPALRLDAPNAIISCSNNYFNKPNSRVMAVTVTATVRAWTNNLITEQSQVSSADDRRYRQATIYHSDRGHISTRPEALLATYDLGDAIFSYGTSNSLLLVGLDTAGTSLGTGDTTRNSHTVPVAAGFDFASLAVGDYVTFSGGVLGVYRVVDIDAVASTITTDVALERNVTGATITKRDKKFYSVALT
jgi:hypothetical protein